MPNDGLDNLTPEPRYGSLISSGDVSLQADIAALDARLDAAEAQLADEIPAARIYYSANPTAAQSATALKLVIRGFLFLLKEQSVR